MVALLPRSILYSTPIDARHPCTEKWATLRKPKLIRIGPQGAPIGPEWKTQAYMNHQRKSYKWRLGPIKPAFLDESPQRGKSTTSLPIIKASPSPCKFLFVNCNWRELGPPPRKHWHLLHAHAGPQEQQGHHVRPHRFRLLQPLSPRRQVPLQRRVRQTQRLHRPLRPLRHRFQLLPPALFSSSPTPGAPPAPSTPTALSSKPAVTEKVNAWFALSPPVMTILAIGLSSLALSRTGDGMRATKLSPMAESSSSVEEGSSPMNSTPRILRRETT